MEHWELAHDEQRDGFHVKLYVTPEYMEPDWDFDSEEDRQDVLRKIDNGTLAYFVARVTASKHGVELGSSVLGGCCYDSVQEFVKSGDYYDDMVNESISEAKDTILKLAS